MLTTPNHIPTDAEGMTASQRDRQALRAVKNTERFAFGLLLVIFLLCAATVAWMPWVGGRL